MTTEAGVATTGAANGPIDVTPGTPAPRAATGIGGGFLVQVSSQRSQETALSTFHDLQRRYPSILGDREPNIQRADLGERGVYAVAVLGFVTRQATARAQPRSAAATKKGAPRMGNPGALSLASIAKAKTLV